MVLEPPVTTRLLDDDHERELQTAFVPTVHVRKPEITASFTSSSRGGEDLDDSRVSQEKVIHAAYFNAKSQRRDKRNYGDW